MIKLYLLPLLLVLLYGPLCAEPSYFDTPHRNKLLKDIKGGSVVPPKNGRTSKGIRWIHFLSRSQKFKETLVEESLFDDLQSMIYLSALIYAFATVRHAIRKGGIPESKWHWNRIQLENYQLIVDNSIDGGNQLVRPLTGVDLEQVLTPSNIDRLSRDPELAGPLNYKALLAMKALGERGVLWEFDDRIGDERELVYAITLNHFQKRVTIVFRGSVSIQDWIANLTTHPKRLGVPTCLQDVDLDIDGDGDEDPIALHKGFCDYLEQSYDHILDNLREIYEKYPTYKLFITGHSLGGALATILSYRLAAASKGEDEAVEVPLPIVCISFAAPLVGNPSFHKVYSALEEKGRLQHVRVTNQNDIVPVSPPGDYTQTGANLHLLGNGNYELSNLPKSNFWSQFNLVHSPSAHALLTYWKEGEASRDKFQELVDKGEAEPLHISALLEKIRKGASSKE